MKNTIFTISVFTFFLWASTSLLMGQSAPRQVYGDTTTGLYILHKVKPKETLFQIGTMYGIRYDKIIAFNKMSSASVLSPYQEIKIPVTRENFVNKDIKINEGLVPVVHVVQPKEGLFRIGTTYYRTPIQLLMKWNALKDYNIKVHQELIVGYIKSRLATITYIGDPNKFQGKPYIPPMRSEGDERAANTLKSTSSVATGTSPTSSAISNETATDPKLTHTGTGFFLNDFNQLWAEGTKGQQTASIKLSVFVSNTGWNDGKYYGMSSKIPAQSIAKLSTKDGKTAYVKILGDLPQKFKGKGYELIISSAGAAQLGIKDDQIVEVDCAY